MDRFALWGVASDTQISGHRPKQPSRLPNYPPRTIIEVHRLNGDDIFEVEGTFYTPKKW